MCRYYAFLIVLILCSCNGEKLSKEQLLRQSIAEIESRFESRKLSQVVEYVDEGYADQQGRNLKDVKRVIQLQIMRHQTLFIVSQIKNIQWIGENQAQVEITAAMTGRDVKDVSLLKSIRADKVSFDVRFVRQNDKFVVSSAAWRHAYPADFL